MLRVKQAALQFVFIKPISSVVELMLDYHGVPSDKYWIYLSIVNNLSISMALYSLVLFYLATKE